MVLRATIIWLLAAVVLAVAAASASALDINFCKEAAGAAKGLGGKKAGSAFKAFAIQGGGTSCEYGGSIGGWDIELIQQYKRSMFMADQRQMKGTPVSGVGTLAFSAPGSGGYTTLEVLDGTNKIVVYSKASISDDKAAAKAVLRLLH